MTEQVPSYADDPETSYPPDAVHDGPDEVVTDDFPNPYAASPQDADAYRAGYHEGAFGDHATTPPDDLDATLAPIWEEGNTAGLRRFAAYRKGFREGIEATLAKEQPTMPSEWHGELEPVWTAGCDAGIARANEIHSLIRSKAQGSPDLDEPSGPVHEYVADGVRWYLQEYGDGKQAVLIGSDGQAYALDHRIFPTYERLGTLRRPLGPPTSDTLAVGDGTGFYATFRDGEIYYTDKYGGHAVRGAIREFWHSLGAPTDLGSLGYPTSDRMDDLVDGGWAQTFERGDIFQWAGSHTPIHLRDIEIHYRGMNCFGDQGGPNPDEPRPIISVIGPSVPAPDGSSAPERAWTITGPEESALGGGSYPRDLPIYHGRASDIAAVAVTLLEIDDGGHTDEYRANIETGIRAAVGTVAGTTAAAGALPVSALILWLGQEGAGPVAEAVTDALGTEDDEIGSCTFQLSPRLLFEMAGRPRQREQDVEFHFGHEALLTDGDASYKVYFDVRFV